MRDLRITMSIRRGDAIVFEDEIDTSQMKRSPEELAAYLGKELAFPGGAFLMTGTGIVPEDDFTLESLGIWSGSRSGISSWRTRWRRPAHRMG